MTTQLDLETTKTILEKEMMDLSPEQTERDHRMYLAGYIDSLFATGTISEGVRGILYMEYAF